jgi:hypothetical protein
MSINIKTLTERTPMFTDVRLLHMVSQFVADFGAICHSCVGFLEFGGIWIGSITTDLKLTNY